MKKNEIIKKFLLNKKQQKLINQYLDILTKYNAHTNLVGKSSLVEPWISHVLDSLQVLPFIKNKNASILDMGTGAGLPGVLLSICGCSDITLMDSNGKKINFLKLINSKLELEFKPILGRLEKANNIKFDYITSRALANLDKLFTYSQKFLKKNTVLIFLKGKTVNEEINFVKKNWVFDMDIKQSISDIRGQLLIIKNLKKND